MKKIHFLLPLIAVLLYVILSSSSGGVGSSSGAERTGATGIAGCGAGCHSASVTATTTIGLTVIETATGLPVTTYVAGRNYTVRMNGSQTSSTLTLPRFGFQISAVKTVTHTAGSGTLTATAGTHTVTAAGLKIVEQSTALTGAFVSGTGGAGTTYSVSATWTAPVAGSGGVTFFSVINAVNANGGQDASDKWNTTNLAITELTDISGISSVCVGSPITLTDVTPGGTWSGGSGFATVAGSGTSATVTGSIAGVATVSYTLGGSTVTKTVSVNALPAVPGSPTGTQIVCAGASTSFSDATPGGTWSSSNPLLGSVNSSGIVTGITAGTTVISYSVTNSCGNSYSVVVVTINPLPLTPGPVNGTPTVCVGNITNLTDAVPGGTWTSVGPNGTIGPSGNFYGISPGTATVSYTETNSCGSIAATRVVTINPLPVTPAAISGTLFLCAGATTPLSNVTAGGLWTSTNPGVGSVNSSGLVTGITAGSTTISYTETTVCGSVASTADVTVNPLPSVPSAISGTLLVCAGGSTTSLTDVTSGGIWSSTNPAIGSISTSGVVTGISSGTTTISYTASNSCGNAAATRIITVNPLPAIPSPISGSLSVCVGAATPLTDVVTGGTWSSANPGVGTVSASGIVTATGIGTTTISYIISNGCGSNSVAAEITVNTLPAAPTSISGTASLCAGGTTPLSNATAGGVWTSTNPSVGTVGTSGIITGIGTGTTTISYTLTNGCGSTAAMLVVTVNPLPTTPAAISGTRSVCEGGATTSLSDVTAGGIWSSVNTAIATIGTSGLVTSVSAGTTTISYTITNSCGSTAAVAIVTVNSFPVTPAAITGSTIVCAGAANTLTDATAGGTWSSTNTGIAAVGSTGIVTGLAGGTSTISYALTNSCGSTAVATDVTVNPLPVSPAPISGAAAICLPGTTSLSDATTGGSWSSSNTSVASIGTDGLVTGIAAGTTIISYAASNSCGTLAATVAVIVSSGPVTPASISGVLTLCSGGATTALSNPTPGGTWSSSNSGVATIGTSGLVTSVSVGTTTISYTETNGCGSIATSAIVTVNALPTTPAAITGTATLCAGGGTTSLTDATGGGSWSSTNTSIATVGSTGIITGISPGTSAISYTESNSCGAIAATRVVTVNPLPAVPAAISGITALCDGGATTTFSDAVTGGTWTSTNTGVAVVGTSGIVTSISAGTSTISYTLTNSCGTLAATVNVTVNPLPVTPSPISGTTTLCAGGTTTLTDIVTGGSWTSTNTSVATISTSGIVSGISGGTSVISYTSSNGCGSAAVTTLVTVNPLPSAGTITGPAAVCTGGNITLTDAVTGGTWMITNSNADVSPLGLVTGNVNGIDTVLYIIVNNSCGADTARKAITVSNTAFADPISGSTLVCISAPSTLSDDISGGTWSSSNTSIATIGSSTGLISGITAGTANITYTVTTGCGTASTSIIVTVTTLPVPPAAITGTATLCAGGATTALTDITSGGVWSSANSSIATVGSSGLVTGLSGGTTTISYTTTTACGSAAATRVVVVNPLPPVPAAISGSASVCQGFSTTLSNTTPGGIWSSTNPATGTVGSTSGIVAGLLPGTTTISYTESNGCGTLVATVVVTVNTIPAPILGTASVCTGATTPLSDASSGGRWSSSNAAVGSIGSLSGIVSGITAGTTFITYTSAAGCRTTIVASVNQQPGIITGAVVTCPGNSAVLSDPTPSGRWSSSNAAIATVGSITGIISGVSAGSVVITYQLLAGGCFSTFIETVNPLPGTITGSTNICSGLTSALTESSTGGLWSSSNTAVGTVGSTSGIVSSLSAGTTIITYALPTGCIATTVVTVTPQPTAILGSPIACAGATTVLSDVVHSGIWTSSNTSVASAGSVTGIITGVSAGTAIITYQLGAGCFVTTIQTVNQSPSAITGMSAVCAGSSSALSNAVTGGTWSSSNTTVATITSTSGALTGLVAGTSFITYALPTGCRTVTVATVNLQPGALLGSLQVCSGSNTILSDAPGSGTWSSGNTAIAAVGSITGIVSGISAGTAVITYQLAAGCFSTAIETVNTTPAAISGTTNICAGAATTLSNTITGGSWASSNITVGTIGTSGILSGLVAGTTNITYTLPTGCRTTTVATVNLQPGAILGAASVCEGTTAILSDAPGSGTWSSSTTSVATIGSVTGIISAVSAGTSTITYQLPGGCFSTITETINAVPAAISGIATVCAGNTTTLSNTAAGGTWSSSNNAVATIGALSGSLSGLVNGTTSISYTLPSGCKTSIIATVNLQPGSILGASSVCEGVNTTLSDIPGTGTWISSNLAVATIGSASGIISPIAAGTTSVTYTLSSGCSSVRIETVNPLPAAITGTLHVCATATTILTDDATGGVWSSSNIAVGSIDPASGILFGLVAGTTNLTYTLPTGCKTASVATVNPQPGIISGASHFCSGTTTTLSDLPSSGGTWSSSNVAVASIGSVTGLVSALSAGTTVITFQLPAGCFTTATKTVDPLPAAIGGITYVCEGAITTLTNDTTGGSWSCSNIAVGTIDATSGVLTGVSQGTTVVTYALSAGCAVSSVITVNLQPATVLGAGSLCTGSTYVLSDITHSGLWTSSSTSVATIGSVTGIISGLSAGTATVTYQLAGGCFSLAVETIDPLPAGISGNTRVCSGASITLSDITPGGSWSVSNNTIGSIDAVSGVFNGLIPGTTTVTYTSLAGCSTALITTVYVQPAQIGGNANVCPGSVEVLADSVHGGLWTSSNSDIATVGSVTGIVNVLAMGSVTITYTMPGGCFSTILLSDTCSTGVVSVAVAENMSIFPNPNTGTFTIRGSFETTGDVYAEVTGVDGKLIYMDKVDVNNGQINKEIILDNALASGMYLLRLQSVNFIDVIHFIISK